MTCYWDDIMQLATMVDSHFCRFRYCDILALEKKSINNHDRVAQAPKKEKKKRSDGYDSRPKSPIRGPTWLMDTYSRACWKLEGFFSSFFRESDKTDKYCPGVARECRAHPLWISSKTGGPFGEYSPLDA